jgi:hypothetical protein
MTDDFPIQHPSAARFEDWLRKYYPVLEPQDVEHFESEEELSSYLKQLEQKGDYFAFELSAPILAERAFNKPLELPDGRTITVNTGTSQRIFLVHSASYDKCVERFADKLEGLGLARRLSLDYEICYYQGNSARNARDLEKAMGGDFSKSDDWITYEAE